ncbi:unnamed protein product, partial [Heterosigma akashiwo]
RGRGGPAHGRPPPHAGLRREPGPRRRPAPARLNGWVELVSNNPRLGSVVL